VFLSARAGKLDSPPFFIMRLHRKLEQADIAALGYLTGASEMTQAMQIDKRS